MREPYILALISPDATLEQVGGKGASLSRLAAAGLPVPTAFHVTTAAYCEFVEANGLLSPILAALEAVDLDAPATLKQAAQDIRQRFEQADMPVAIASAIARAYAELPGSNPAVAVRSSATAEDLPEASFAGQQETYLNVSGAGLVLDAAQQCWASLWTARAIAYRARQGIAPEGVALAVVVQILVPAEASGILFTANPVNGRRDQAVISAAWGLGEAVVGGTVTPDTLTVDKATGHVLTRETADKQVMTVRTTGATAEQPVPPKLRRLPVLSDQAAAELTRLAVQIEELYGRPMDIEWAWVDGRFAIVQARPITRLVEPALPTPDTTTQISWVLSNPKDQFMRSSIVELLPDPLSPLFESLGLPAIEQGIDIMAQDLFNMPATVLTGFMQTINGYAYQKVSFTGRQWWWLLTRLLPAIPRMLREGVPYWRDVAHPRYVAAVSRWRDQDLVALSSEELWAGVLELMNVFGHHLASLMASTMGPSAGSEGLFTRVYEKMIRQEGDPTAPAFLLGFDSIPLRAEKALYDLAQWCQEREALATYLNHTPTDQLLAQMGDDQIPNAVPPAEWANWHNRFRQHLADYGHLIYDMDLAKPLPADDPAPILETLKMYLMGQGKNPYERQHSYTKRREQSVQSIRPRLKGLKRWAFDKALKWAQSQAPLREDGIAELGLAYPVLRRILHELGHRLVRMEALQEHEDVYWLERGEIEAALGTLARGNSPGDMTDTVARRQQLWQTRKQVTPPPQIPPGKKYLGMDMEALLAGGGFDQSGDVIKGAPTSPGQVTATARVLHGPEDMDQMRPGDILVASITTPAWTPLFAMAAGVVTDIGGALSHSSIVAREYGIPAVLGTGMATKRIRSGQTITVDGGAGTVTLHEE